MNSQQSTLGTPTTHRGGTAHDESQDTIVCGLRPALRPKSAFALLKSTYFEWSKDKVTRMGAALAYYTIFSLTPLLVIAIAIAGLAFGVEAAQGEVTGQIQGLIGHDGAKTVQTMIQSAHNIRNRIACHNGSHTFYFLERFSERDKSYSGHSMRVMLEVRRIVVINVL